MGINQKSGAKTKLPFMLSADFANKFDQVLCQYLIPELTRRCQEIVTRGAKRAAAKQKSYLQQFTGFEGGRGEIWEHWRQTWTDMTAKQKLPTRPTGKGGTKKKKGLFGMPLKKTGRRGRCGEGRDRPLEGPDRPIGKDQRPCGCGLGYPLRGFRPLPAAGPRYRRQAFDGPLRTQHQEHHETGSRHQPDREPRRGTGPCLRGFANRQGYRDLPAGRLFPEPRALSRAQTDPQAIFRSFSATCPSIFAHKTFPRPIVWLSPCPTWRWTGHRADEDGVLFSMTDGPLLRFAHYYKFEGG